MKQNQWRMSCEKRLITYADSDGSDKIVQIRTFIVRLMLFLQVVGYTSKAS